MGKAGIRRAGGHYREVKVRRGFYEELRRLAGAEGLSVPALIEAMFKHYVAPGKAPLAAPGKAAPAKPVQISLWQEDPFWILIRAGEGPRAVEVSLNRLQLAKLCNAGLLAEEVCAKAREVAKRG